MTILAIWLYMLYGYTAYGFYGYMEIKLMDDMAIWPLGYMTS
jgi:hypothetical protein